MKPADQVQASRAAIRAAVARRKAANPRLFGSVARGEDRSGSDIDILVDPLPGATLFDLGGLQVDLESILGRRVDLVTPAELPPRFRARVLEEAVPI
ncbi:MAG: nucleotidyltransferase family protein [Methylobacteriaceae bacterium]|nr:nucleotidyltransferase family protein [Methylobacteriaceae bacterium]